MRKIIFPNSSDKSNSKLEFFSLIFLKVDSLVFEKNFSFSFFLSFSKGKKHFQLGEIELGTLDFRKVHFIEIELAQNAFKGLQINLKRK